MEGAVKLRVNAHYLMIAERIVLIEINKKYVKVTPCA
jgi:hypothetical protein